MEVFIGFCIIAVVFARQETCSENQTYNDCGTRCALTCENYDNPPKICGLMCKPGCHCDDGYVKTGDERCVLPKDCPEKIKSSKGIDIQNKCLVKSEQGPCRGYFPRWYYNEETATCQKFVYGGCGGNGNRYETEKLCLLSCKGVKSKISTSNICYLPADSGPCRAYFRRFYFDKTSGQCKPFVFGGCRGNENNFRSEGECTKTCRIKGVKPSISTPNVCYLPAVSGPCLAYLRRFYFDRASGQCKSFIFGGCDGNGNNFRSEEECTRTCIITGRNP